jgi:hypothetical protein
MKNHPPPPRKDVQGSNDPAPRAKREAPPIKRPKPSEPDPAVSPKNQAPGSGKLEAYYDDSAKDYLVREENGSFMRCSEGSLARKLNRAGVSAKKEHNGRLSAVEEQIDDIQQTKKVDYVGRLAGYPGGYWEVYGRRLLITREAQLAKPRDTGNTAVADFFVRLLGTEQADVLFSWAKLAVVARRAGIERLTQGLPPNFRAGQYLGIAGDTDNGKTVGSRLLVWTISSLDEMKGDLSQFHKGQTTFNADGARHETHVIDDEGGSDSATGRREMLESIKKGTGQQEKRIHGKGQDGETLELFNRTIMLLNRGIADLRILPDVEDKGMREKIHLLKSVANAVDCDTTDTDDFNRYFDELRAAIPDFIYFLDHFTIPEKLRGGRFGMLAYHNPELLLDLGELSSTTDFWEMLDDSLILSSTEPYIGTTGQLFSRLLTEDYGRRVMTVAKTPSMFGKMVHAAADQAERLPEGARRIKRLGRSHGSAERFAISSRIEV